MTERCELPESVPGASHEHSHSHGSRLTLTGQHRNSLIIVLLITLSVAIAEATGAWISGGLVLFADAAHMAADVAGIGLSLLAVVFASGRRPRSGRSATPGPRFSPPW